MNQIIQKNIDAHKKLLTEFESFSPVILQKISLLIIDTFKQGGFLYLCGNGGSASDAQHVAGELIGRFKTERKPLPAIALNTDTSVLTCIGNDYSFKDVFARQVEALLRKGDILWTFSTSGNSPNIIAAAEAARLKFAKVIAFTGKENSQLEKISDICLCVRTSVTSNAQEMHQLAYHTICDLVEYQVVNYKE
jgi:D-sedoheptulose 7-phosphate isomerase